MDLERRLPADLERCLNFQITNSREQHAMAIYEILAASERQKQYQTRINEGIRNLPNYRPIL